MNPRDQRGTITAFVAIVAVALVMVAGMAYDGGRVIATQAEVRAAAAKAARAGAQEIDLTTLRATGETVLDPTAAETAALAYLERSGATGTVTVDTASITVTVTDNLAMAVLPTPDRAITATKTATAVDGALP